MTSHVMFHFPMFNLQYLIDHMKSLDWHIETDAFEDETPYGSKHFENIIATLNPDVPRRLVMLLVINCFWMMICTQGIDIV